MSELGQYLKQVREQKQITLEDLQRTTKIQKRYLVAIEEGRYETLPGLFYARAFVKTYAESIGLDPEPLFDQYRNELPNPQQETVALPSRSERTKKTAVTPKKRTRGNTLLPAVLGIAGVIVVVVLIWLLAQSMGWGGDGGEAVPPDMNENVELDSSDEVGTEPEEEENSAEEEPPASEPDEEEQEEQEPPEPETELTFIESSGNTSYYQLENGQLDDVRIELTGTSHIDVKNALGHTFFTGMPTEGEVLTFDELAAEEEVLFNFGASPYVELYINGERLEFPLDIVHQKVTITVVGQNS
ncbi:helix-turn-helix domain-containing protein [Alkalihalobacillus oceani]|uniref:Helix-turn-helix domain-containing protein n=1 Tax=Halalkalibacter oceani TaxID=1653776 RepID=A0A9X2DM34_9BACI|nr:helix-turn-helix domain-containing protein [Halalkalibacter oceani]MCM3713261.1 helix-turn-helix domain-containing protein [Halalkalibacter oceani]